MPSIDGLRNQMKELLTRDAKKLKNFRGGGGPPPQPPPTGLATRGAAVQLAAVQRLTNMIPLGYDAGPHFPTSVSSQCWFRLLASLLDNMQ